MIDLTTGESEELTGYPCRGLWLTELERLREVEKDSTDLHTIVKQQATQLRLLKLKIQTAINMLNAMVKLGGFPDDFGRIIKHLENDKDITGEGLIKPDTTLELRNNGEPVTPPIQKYVNFPQDLPISKTRGSN